MAASDTDPDTDAPASDDPVARATFAHGALALGAGALVALSLPPWGFWPLAFVGIALFYISIPNGVRRRTRARQGLLFGAGWMYFGMGWMIQLTAPGYLAAGLIFATFHAIAAAASPTGEGRVVGSAAAHALAETVRFSFPFGGVPLATLGMSQVESPLVGIVRVGGVPLLSLIVFLISFGIAADFGPGPSLPVRLQRIGAIAVGAVLLLASFVAPSGTATGETLRVAIVQGGGEQGTSALDVPSILVTQRHLEATATIDVDPELDLVFWPENTIDVEDFATSDLVVQIGEQADRLDVPIAVGLTESVIVDGRRRYTNAHVVVTGDGEIFSRYDKVRRVPFGEYVPLRNILERISSAVDQVGNAIPGETPAVLDLPSGERLATVISWEVFFGGRSREGVRLDAEMIANPTNGASYTGTIVQTQQVASSRLRAIETGRSVIQAAPTGFSAFIASDGTVIERTAQREQIVIVDDVELRTGLTWYTQLGDRPFIAVLIATLIAGHTLTRRGTPMPDAPTAPAAR